MVIAFFGDVHGNLIALEKFFELEKESSDYFVCHGDVVNYGPWSNECVEFLDDQVNCEVLQGNHEKYFLEERYDGTNRIAKTFFDHCIKSFKPELLSILDKYEESIVIKDFTIQHTIFDQYIFADTNLESVTINSNYIIGHSHQQFKRIIGDKVLLNTGSIGQNRQYLNQSCYLKLDTRTNKIELKSFIHDVDRVINQMKSKKYPKDCLEYYLNKQVILK